MSEMSVHIFLEIKHVKSTENVKKWKSDLLFVIRNIS